MHGIIKGRERLGREMTDMEPQVDEEKENMRVELDELKIKLIDQKKLIDDQESLRKEQQERMDRQETILADLVAGQKKKEQDEKAWRDEVYFSFRNIEFLTLLSDYEL